jgi:GNAT superfamily N-acetyltransferase
MRVGLRHPIISINMQYFPKNEITSVVKINKAKEHDWGEIIRICDKTLGKDYIKSLKTTQLEFFVAKTPDFGVVGFVAFKNLPEKSIHKEFPSINIEKLPAFFKYCNSNGLVKTIKTIAVDPKHHGKGIGTKLFKSAHEKCSDSNTNAIVVPAWKQRDVINIQSILKNKGYTLLTEVPGFWKYDCEKKLFKCPSKKTDGPCVCSLAIFWQLITKQ